MYKLLIRPILFCFDPEKVHYFTFSLIRIVSKIPGFTAIFRALYVVNDKRLETEVFGLTFKNPVGLAAGFDKDAKLYKELSNFLIQFTKEENKDMLLDYIDRYVDLKEVTQFTQTENR